MDSRQVKKNILLKTQKGFEGKSAFFCWSGSFKSTDGFHKCHLIADAEQQSFGVRLSVEKPENLNPTGGVVAQMRKHVKSPTIGRVLKDLKTGDWWLELNNSPGETPEFWLHLCWGHPPELKLMDQEKLIYIRKSSQGTFTKKRTWEGLLPTELEEVEPDRFTCMNDELARLFVASIKDEANTLLKENGEDTQSPTTSEAATGLPDYQKEARDRLARRLKTVRKSAEKIIPADNVASELTRLERLTELTQTWLHTVKEGDHLLDLSFLPDLPPDLTTVDLDPDKSPGANLEAMYMQIKKLKKAIAVNTKLERDTRRDIETMETDLARLRAAPMDLAATEEILQTHKLAAKKQPVKKVSSPKHLPWRMFQFKDGGKSVKFFIGKSAADNDELCKKARSNDTWMHAVGVTGSHVIIPAKDAGTSPSPDLIRTAGILALHFSKLRDNQRGEVYLSKRQFIRKQKGMAPGLWTVDKATSLFIKYDDDELQKALDRFIA